MAKKNQSFNQFVWQDADAVFVHMQNGETAAVVGSEQSKRDSCHAFIEKRDAYLLRIKSAQADYNLKLERVKRIRTKRLKDARDAEILCKKVAQERAASISKRNNSLVKTWAILALLASVGIGIFGIVMSARIPGGTTEKTVFMALSIVLLIVGALIAIIVIAKGCDCLQHKPQFVFLSILTVWILCVGVLPSPIAKSVDKRLSANPIIFKAYQSGYEMTALYNFTDRDLIVPATYQGKPVLKLSNKAFDNGATITNLVLPDTLTEIDNGAFENLFQLKTLELSLDNMSNRLALLGLREGLTTLIVSGTSLPDAAFSNIQLPITDVIIKDSVTTIGQQAFYLSKLGSLTLPDSLQIIEKGLFIKTAISEIVLPRNLKKIESEAFHKMGTMGGGIVHVYLRSIVPPQVEDDSFSDSYNIHFHVPRTEEYGDESIDYYADWQQYEWAQDAQWSVYDMQD